MGLVYANIELINAEDIGVANRGYIFNDILIWEIL